MAFDQPPALGNGIVLVLCKIWQKLTDGIAVTLAGGDIQIGAVEIKNGGSDTRAEVTAGNALKVDGSAVTQPVSITGNQAVNLVQVAGAAVATGSGTAAGSVRVELPTNGTGVVGLNTGSNIVGRVGVDQTTPGTTNLVATISGQNGVAGGAGATAATVQRIVVANDDPALPPRVADNAASTGNPDYVGGLAVNLSTYAPAYTASDRAIFPFDITSGGLGAHIRTLTTTDAITNTPVASSLSSSVAYETNRVAKASAGRLFVVNGYNSLGSAQFIQVHNATSLPADTAIPVCVITVAASSNFSIDFGPLGIPLSIGIVLCNSSTGPTKTIGAANCYFTVSYT